MLRKFVVVVIVGDLAPTVHQGGDTRAIACIEAAYLAAKIADNHDTKVVNHKNQNGVYKVQTPSGVATVTVGRNMEYGSAGI